MNVVDRRHGAYLPHWSRNESIYAVTFRQADSLPMVVLDQWVRERANIVATAEQMGRMLSDHELSRLAELHSEKVEQWLNSGYGSCLLRKPAAARIVAEALGHFNGTRYELLSWCVMPNHVHAVLRPYVDAPLPTIIHSWKSFTARMINQLFHRTGTVWQPEYFDHLIRNDADLRRQVAYVKDNPMRAHLHEWPWVG